MKKSRFLSLGLIAAIGMVVSGCNTPNTTLDTSVKFHESASANVVLRFYRWDHLFVMRPDFRDSGFLRPLKKDDLSSVFHVLGVRHDMAVVVMGWYFDQELQKQDVENWKDFLRSQGFQRVVWVRGNDGDKLDGLPVIEDWRDTVEQKQTAKL